MPVSCICLRNLDNFKGLFQATTNKIPNITKSRSFLIDLDDGEVRVSFKVYMHNPKWTGMDRDGRFSASAPTHLVFIGPVPRMRDAPDYPLKVVQEKTVHNTELRYKPSTYLLGECNARPSVTIVFIVAVC